MCVARNRTDELFSRVLPFAVVRSVAVDPLLQNDGRLEHHYSTRGHRHLGDLRIAADAPAFFEILFRGSVSLPSRNPRSLRSKCASRHGNATPDHASVYDNGVIQGATVRALRHPSVSRHRRRATRTPSRNATSSEPSGASRAILLRILNGIPGFRPASIALPTRCAVSLTASDTFSMVGLGSGAGSRPSYTSGGGSLLIGLFFLAFSPPCNGGTVSDAISCRAPTVAQAPQVPP